MKSINGLKQKIVDDTKLYDEIEKRLNQRKYKLMQLENEMELLARRMRPSLRMSKSSKSKVESGPTKP